MYSDPGFINGETLTRLTHTVGLGDVTVVGSDVGRGLLQDVDGELSAGELLPVAEDEEAPAAAAGTPATPADASLEHMKKFWAQRPQDWSEYGGPPKPPPEENEAGPSSAGNRCDDAGSLGEASAGA